MYRLEQTAVLVLEVAGALVAFKLNRVSRSCSKITRSLKQVDKFLVPGRLLEPSTCRRRGIQDVCVTTLISICDTRWVCSRLDAI